ncbi:unnamed protein product [Rotaria sp. Silwood1]|nr:unnamed protein product [Rotaria sp. Silwood1]CAF1629772.1 unnamed protein product [Rotaria sp. Silwood1]
MDKLSKSVEVLKLLSTTTSQTLIINVEKLFTKCDENDYGVRLTAEENLNHLNLKEVDLTRIQVELHGVITHNPNVEPTALKVNVIYPKKIRSFFEHLSAAFCSIAAHSEDIVHKKLLEYYELICRILGRLINDKEIKSSKKENLCDLRQVF